MFGDKPEFIAHPESTAYLPAPLYTLYHAISSYRVIYGSTLTATIDGNVQRAKALFEAAASDIKSSDSSDDSSSAAAGTGGPSTKRQRLEVTGSAAAGGADHKHTSANGVAAPQVGGGGGSTAAAAAAAIALQQQQAMAEMLTLHPLSVVVSMKVNGAGAGTGGAAAAVEVSFRFRYLSNLHVATVTPDLAAGGKQWASDHHWILTNLYPDDSGVELPNAIEPLLYKAKLNTLRLDHLQFGTPYRWVQSLCGLQYLHPRLQNAQTTHPVSIADVVRRLERRFATRTNLLKQLTVLSMIAHHTSHITHGFSVVVVLIVWSGGGVCRQTLISFESAGCSIGSIWQWQWQWRRQFVAGY